MRVLLKDGDAVLRGVEVEDIYFGSAKVTFEDGSVSEPQGLLLHYAGNNSPDYLVVMNDFEARQFVRECVTNGHCDVSNFAPALYPDDEEEEENTEENNEQSEKPVVTGEQALLNAAMQADTNRR